MHNISRSAGYALLALQDWNLVIWFVCGEMVLYFAFKILRGDWMYWLPIEGFLSGHLVTLLARIITKSLVDFTGCLQFRHPSELGGCAFAASMLWAQVFPFVALHIGGSRDSYLDSDTAATAKIFFLGILVSWTLLVVAFCFTINQSFLSTFYDMKTGPESVCERFIESEIDENKFDAAFMNRLR